MIIQNNIKYQLVFVSNKEELKNIATIKVEIYDINENEFTTKKIKV